MVQGPELAQREQGHLGARGTGPCGWRTPSPESPGPHTQLRIAHSNRAHQAMLREPRGRTWSPRRQSPRHQPGRRRQPLPQPLPSSPEPGAEPQACPPPAVLPPPAAALQVGPASAASEDIMETPAPLAEEPASTLPCFLPQRCCCLLRRNPGQLWSRRLSPLPPPIRQTGVPPPSTFSSYSLALLCVLFLWGVIQFFIFLFLSFGVHLGLFLSSSLFYSLFLLGLNHCK
uniref:Uncharacterized protein n=1 Tax=Molossus molossus TaxID=27622 RepID=A0A7J8BMW4_MOLMO|nr:hypothetical protein HJG59_010118 [Molossus molossus]